MSKARPNAGILAAILLVIVLPPAGYMGAYYGLVRDTLTVQEWMDWQQRPAYHYGGRVAASFFRPAHEVDKLIRPMMWSRPSPHYTGE